MIDSVDKLLELIFSQDNDPDKTLFYRGQKKDYKMISPSIAMNGFIKQEDKLFKEYILRNPNDFIDAKTTFEKLVIMQHYKLPTRLLDITTNPLVALYFAVEPDKKYDDEDGCFIIFSIPNQNIKYYDSDTVSVVSNIAKRPFNGLTISHENQKSNEDDNEWIKRFNKNKDISYLHHEIKDEKPYFKEIINKQHLEAIWCVKPLLSNRRIVKQDGAFLLFGINGSKEHLAGFSDIKPFKHKVNKVAIRKQLRLLGVTKDKIYPELDTTAEYLKDIFGEK